MSQNAAATPVAEAGEANRLLEIDSEEQIPEFANEDEEAEFWATHSFSDRYLREHPPVELDWLPPVREVSNPVSVRFDRDTLSRLKSVARKKGKGYQTLLKEFVMERLYEEEKREGIIPAEAPVAPPPRTRKRVS